GDTHFPYTTLFRSRRDTVATGMPEASANLRCTPRSSGSYPARVSAHFSHAENGASRGGSGCEPLVMHAMYRAREIVGSWCATFCLPHTSPPLAAWVCDPHWCSNTCAVLYNLSTNGSTEHTL